MWPCSQARHLHLSRTVPTGMDRDALAAEEAGGCCWGVVIKGDPSGCDLDFKRGRRHMSVVPHLENPPARYLRRVGLPVQCACVPFLPLRMLGTFPAQEEQVLRAMPRKGPELGAAKHAGEGVARQLC